MRRPEPGRCRWQLENHEPVQERWAERFSFTTRNVWRLLSGQCRSSVACRWTLCALAWSKDRTLQQLHSELRSRICMEDVAMGYDDQGQPSLPPLSPAQSTGANRWMSQPELASDAAQPTAAAPRAAAAVVTRPREEQLAVRRVRRAHLGVQMPPTNSQFPPTTTKLSPCALGRWGPGLLRRRPSAGPRARQPRRPPRCGAARFH